MQKNKETNKKPQPKAQPQKVTVKPGQTLLCETCGNASCYAVHQSMMSFAVSCPNHVPKKNK